MVVTKKEKETNDICSFYFENVDGEPLPHFIPGEF
jgi:ferredoxin-NADP reductase